VPSFNDDIQGTGAMVLAGLYGALRIKEEGLEEQRIVFFGAGSAASGISQNILTGMMLDGGLSREEALKRFWVFDKFGLVTESNRDQVPPPMAQFARKGKNISDLLTLIKRVKPTVLIGVSGQGKAFNEAIVREMHKHVRKPIIFALSNPTRNSECTAEQAYTWTGGEAIFASGSPFRAVRLNGRILTAGQGNNMYIFPGVGLGAKLCGARRVTDSMFIAAARTLALMVNDHELSIGAIFPDLGKIRQISIAIAAAVCRVAYAEGEATVPEPDDIIDYVRNSMYHPYYPEYIAATE
jgi:malate dehydrogenase (oxaloacetate-decarboxylating)(NADP+)